MILTLEFEGAGRGAVEGPAPPSRSPWPWPILILLGRPPAAAGVRVDPCWISESEVRSESKYARVFIARTEFD